MVNSARPTLPPLLLKLPEPQTEAKLAKKHGKIAQPASPIHQLNSLKILFSVMSQEDIE